VLGAHATVYSGALERAARTKAGQEHLGGIKWASTHVSFLDLPPSRSLPSVSEELDRWVERPSIERRRHPCRQMQDGCMHVPIEMKREIGKGMACRSPLQCDSEWWVECGEIKDSENTLYMQATRTRMNKSVK
jgi:hypothetical protein